MSATTCVIPSSLADRHAMMLLHAIADSVHTLSQPLTSISFALDLLTTENNTASSRTMLLAAQAECERAMLEIDQLRIKTNELIGSMTTGVVRN